MKLKEIIDSIQRNAEGAVTTAGSRFSPLNLKKMINSYRAAIIEKNYQVNDMINPVCYQRFNLFYSKDLQYSAPEGSLLFQLPSVIQLGEEDGIRYVGSKDCPNGWNRIVNRGQMNNMNKHPITSIQNNPDIVFVLFDGTTGNLEVYNGLNIREGVVEGIFADPLAIPEFNEDTDDYPMAKDDIAQMETMIYAQRTAIAKNTPPEDGFNIPDYKEGGPPKGENIRLQ